MGQGLKNLQVPQTRAESTDGGCDRKKGGMGLGRRESASSGAFAQAAVERNEKSSDGLARHDVRNETRPTVNLPKDGDVPSNKPNR